MKARQTQDKRIQRGNSRGVMTRILGDRLATAWRAILLAMILAVSWQGFVAQTHYHPEGATPFAGAPMGATVLVDVAASADHKKPLKLPDSCAICRELAHAGSMLLPTPAEFTPPVAIAAPVAETPPALQAHVQRTSHRWQSRAPPENLQA
ncbi:MAG: hypothetical protein V4808_10035 [Pseudomonadota bacterium]